MMTLKFKRQHNVTESDTKNEFEKRFSMIRTRISHYKASTLEPSHAIG